MADLNADVAERFVLDDISSGFANEDGATPDGARLPLAGEAQVVGRTIVAPDRAAVQWELNDAEHSGEILGVHPRHGDLGARRVTIQGCSLVEVDDHDDLTVQRFVDWLSVATQLGLTLSAEPLNDVTVLLVDPATAADQADLDGLAAAEFEYADIEDEDEATPPAP